MDRHTHKRQCQSPVSPQDAITPGHHTEGWIYDKDTTHSMHTHRGGGGGGEREDELLLSWCESVVQCISCQLVHTTANALQNCFLPSSISPPTLKLKLYCTERQTECTLQHRSYNSGTSTARLQRFQCNSYPRSRQRGGRCTGDPYQNRESAVHSIDCLQYSELHWPCKIGEVAWISISVTQKSKSWFACTLALV